MSELLKRLKGGDINSKALESSSAWAADTEAHPHRTRHALISTIHFVALCSDFDPSHPLLSKALSLFGHLPSKGKDLLGDTLKMLAAGGNPSTLTSSFHYTWNITSHTGLATALPAAVDPRSSRSFVPALYFHYFKSLTRGERSTDVMRELLQILRFPSLESQAMVALLFMLRSFLLTNPVIPPKLLEEAGKSIQPYFLWPNPYGSIAKDMLRFITNELRSPGSAHRFAAIEEFPELAGKRGNGLERRVYVLLNTASRFGATAADMLQESKDKVSVSAIKRSVLKHIVEIGMDSYEDLALENAKSDKFNKFYNDGMDIMLRSLSMSEGKAADYRQAQLSQLKREIQNHTHPDLKKNKGSGKGKPLPTLVQLPDLEIDGTFLDNEPTLAIKSLTGNGYVKPATTKVLEGILTQEAYGKAKHKHIVKIAVGGGDATLHNVVAAYVALKQEKAAVFGTVDVRFYVLPLGRQNRFASFLGAYDGWYGRNMTAVSTGALKLVPALSKGQAKAAPDMSKESSVLDKVFSGSKSSGRKANPRTPSPMQLLRDTWQSYFREARHAVAINVYEVQMWEGSPSDKKPTRVVPFLQRVEIGFAPQAKAFLESKGQHGDDPFNDIARHTKSFKPVPVEVSIKYTQMNYYGLPRQGDAPEVRQYKQVSIGNIPATTDQGTCPNPTVPWLEMVAIDPDTGKKKKKGVVDEHTYHVSTVEIEVPPGNTKFPMLIDGETYGPFSKVKITPCKLRDTSEIIVFPVMNYFPLDL